MAIDVSRVRAVLFDVDGTLRDTDDEVIDRGARLIRPMVGHDRATRWMRRTVMWLENPLQHVLSQADRFGVDGQLNRLAARLSPGGHGGTRLVDGAAELVAQLQPHFALGIVSAGPARVVADFVGEHGLGDAMRTVVTGQTCPRTKPHPEPVIAAMRALELDPSTGVMVGDTTVDIRAGKAAGAQAIGVLTGFGERAELERAGADIVVATLHDLARILAA